ncbi:XRE family transcriptional regulator [Companilactobacillus allii]|uniref:Transcriptional regulator n=1 Tax=Companilactobacillus allii TaxID=1847728 RepID=A0A1P8Q5M3_9LACO|nr:transcriptional regulator [Companilactobacillus allii]APX73141.1 transcriptional regulator [Companilactobacillus allii]USQ67945.1 XRE family transcriptional regulator [Companilactobacillus allii]
MPEQQFMEYAHQIESSIKTKLFERHMTQRELSGIIDENPVLVNKAIKGDTSPKSQRIREKIGRVLNI